MRSFTLAAILRICFYLFAVGVVSGVTKLAFGAFMAGVLAYYLWERTMTKIEKVR